MKKPTRQSGRGYFRAFFAALTLAVTMAFGATLPVFAADTGGYPYAGYKGPGSNPAGSYWTDAKGNPASPYGYYYRNCTDYVAWKLRAANGFSVPGGIGNGAAWGIWAGNNHYAVNSTPAVGAVAWWGANTSDQGYSVGSFGHVAWVSGVNNGNVTIGEYNKLVNGVPDGSYHTRTMSASNAKYIHFKDLQAGSSGGSSSGSSSSWNGVGGSKFLGSDRLTTGQNMYGGQYILSGDGRFVLTMQSDGNLVEYSSGKAVWNSGTSGHAGSRVVVQSDGNVVIYDKANHPLWNTGQKSIKSFVVQSDAHVVAYTADGRAPWASSYTTSTKGMRYVSGELKAGATLAQNQYLRSPDKRHFALMQDDGNFVLYGPGYHVLWSTHTGGHQGSNPRMTVQSDGNIVIYDKANHPLWNTGKRGSARLVMQSDGNLVAYNAAGKATWASNTNGKL